MADASCSGPSPFKRLVDHQQRDVSHHQDRFVNQPGAGQHGSFRSTPSPAGQAAQDGFGAFMNSNNMMMPGAPHHAAGRLAATAAALEPAHALNLPHSPHSFSQSHIPQQNHQAPDMSNWAADFARFSSSPQPAMQQASPQVHHQAPQVNFHAAFAQPNGGFQPLYGPTNGGFMDPTTAVVQRPAQEADFDEEMSRWMAANGAQNAKAMEDVDAVMEQMARELELNEHQLDINTTDATVEPVQHFTDLGGSEIGNLQTASEPVAEEQAQADTGRSEVSEAAERLLDSVKHEDGDKWKNSIFLSLMRDFRDGRKDIVGDEIRETADDVVGKKEHAT